jgi:hypothetical protein
MSCDNCGIGNEGWFDVSTQYKVLKSSARADHFKSTTSKIAGSARTSNRTYIRVAGTGCAKNSRHTVAAAMLTASTLSSHHVRL